MLTDSTTTGANMVAARAGRILALAAATYVALVSVGQASGATAPGGRHHPIGLGKVLTSKDGGQIYGFDINQNGDDGVLTTAQDSTKGFLVSVETFDQNTGKIIKSFAKEDGPRDSYSMDGIFAGDVALITHFIVPKNSIYAKRKYEVMNPVTGNAFTGPWTPPVKDVDVQLAAENQDSATSVVYVIELKNQDVPDLLISDVATNTFGKVVHLNPSLFGLCNGPQLGQFIAASEAVVAASPDCGAVGGQAPLNALVSLDTGKITQFNGYNNGFYHAGYVNGLGVDPNTGIAATTTELNAQVEFYDLNQKKGIGFTQLPCTGNTDQTYSGSGIAVDPINKVFLVTETYNACSGGSDSALVVFDEAGNVVESITGFKFFIGEHAPALNFSKRMGWAFGGPNGWTQLQQFFY